ncbi:MAG: T9SS type A sorting domain-containing protein [Bacteroidota bacterium]
MKKLFLLALTLISLGRAQAQVTITAADMPVAGDTLRYSIATAFGSPVLAEDSGTGLHWHYTDLVPTSQAVDTYKYAHQVNSSFASTISLSAAGYKVADSIPGLSLVLPAGLTIRNIYNYFEKTVTPPAYIAAAFSASIGTAGFSLSLPFNYTSPDVWYHFPLTYGRMDSSEFDLDISLLSFGSIKQKGYRKTRVDGWGVLMTPYATSPVNCIRVRSEIHEIDSVSLDTTGTFGIPRVTVEYKWLANGEHYPLVWLTLNEVGGAMIPTILRYRDVYREMNPNAVPNTPAAAQATVTAYPNPAPEGIVNIDVPAGWANFYVEVFDLQGRLINSAKDNRQVDISAHASGSYIARITCGDNISYVKIVK